MSKNTNLRSPKLIFSKEKLNSTRSKFHLDRPTVAESKKLTFFFVGQFYEISKITQCFTSIIDLQLVENCMRVARWPPMASTVQ